MDQVTGPLKYQGTLTNNNGDASLGDGTLECSYSIVGRMMTIRMLLTWGATSAWGTVAPFIPYPPGYDETDIDTDALLDGGGTKFFPGSCSANPGGGSPVPASALPTFIFGLLILYPLDGVALTPGDIAILEFSLPLK